MGGSPVSSSALRPKRPARAASRGLGSGVQTDKDKSRSRCRATDAGLWPYIAHGGSIDVDSEG